EKTRKPLSFTSQSFNISILSAEDLITLFLANNIEQRMEQEAENEVEHKIEEIDNEEIERIKKFKIALNYKLGDSDIEETILSFKTLLIFIKALVFNNVSNFPETLYKAKDAISFNKTIIQFVVYHFLTNLESISNNSQ
ncbi:36131_t:CDS:2, partial [Gigaspora margarita]